LHGSARDQLADAGRTIARGDQILAAALADCADIAPDIAAEHRPIVALCHRRTTGRGRTAANFPRSGRLHRSGR